MPAGRYFGAFVLIVAASVVLGIFAGGFTTYMMIPLGVVLASLGVLAVVATLTLVLVMVSGDGEAAPGQESAEEEPADPMVVSAGRLAWRRTGE